MIQVHVFEHMEMMLKRDDSPSNELRLICQCFLGFMPSINFRYQLPFDLSLALLKVSF